MNATERELLDQLFGKISQIAAQSGPRDAAAEKLIDTYVRGVPHAAYYMAQLLIVQRQALRQAEARIAALTQQGGGGGFLPQQPAWQQPAAPYEPPRSGPFATGGGNSFLRGGS
jgi:hypothetical protein